MHKAANTPKFLQFKCCLIFIFRIVLLLLILLFLYFPKFSNKAHFQHSAVLLFFFYKVSLGYLLYFSVLLFFYNLVLIVLYFYLLIFAKIFKLFKAGRPIYFFTLLWLFFIICFSIFITYFRDTFKIHPRSKSIRSKLPSRIREPLTNQG